MMPFVAPLSLWIKFCAHADLFQVSTALFLLVYECIVPWERKLMLEALGAAGVSSSLVS